MITLSACRSNSESPTPVSETPAEQGSSNEDEAGNEDGDASGQDDANNQDEEDLGAPQPSGGACTPSMELSCGTSVTGDTSESGSESIIDRYACTTWNATGPELAYSFTAEESGSVAAVLAEVEAGQDLDVYVMEDLAQGCHSDGCVAFGDLEAIFDVVAGSTYYVVIDGYVGAAGSFVLELECAASVPGDDDDSGPEDDGLATQPSEDCDDGLDNDGDGVADCGDSDCVADINCTSGVCSADGSLSEGASISGTNDASGSTSVMNTYNCQPNWNESGPEYVYQYVAATNGQVSVEINETADELLEYVVGSFDDLDLFVLNGTASCDPGNCVASGDNSVNWYVTAGSAWYIVVDGFEGDVSPYTLSLTVLSSGPAPALTETDCADGLDDDGDSAVDCADSDCASAAPCVAAGDGDDDDSVAGDDDDSVAGDDDDSVAGDDDDSVAGVDAVVAGTGLPASVPPAGNTGTTVVASEVAPAGLITDLDVAIDITHSYMSDLRGVLTSPSGTSVLLFEGLTTCCQNMSNTLFDDEAPAPISSGSPPYTGSFQPLESLSVFDGEDSAGVWTLSVTDSVVGDSGTLDSWSLEFRY
ncbi:MAG: hypothetical protein CMP23_06390 [Rickettsiales bacterium]|nr:hypothetical protein [Rickettsiales bacterium]